MIEPRTTEPLCSRCGSSRVKCSAEYYTAGGDMEHVEFTHHCEACGHEESTIEQGSYGYDWKYSCPLTHR
jgi:hypothetical protein